MVDRDHRIMPPASRQSALPDAPPKREVLGIGDDTLALPDPPEYEVDSLFHVNRCAALASCGNL
jgi:hypothetical protein